jgi:hypothetical protein
MVLDWRAKGRTAGLPELLARKQYAQAVALAQTQLARRPRDGRARLQLADTLIAAGRGREAVPLLRGMADELATEGFAAKAIAILKRIEKIDPGRVDVQQRLAATIAQRARQDGARPQPSASAAAFPEIGIEEIGFEPPAVAASVPESAFPDAPLPEAGEVAMEAEPLADFEPLAAEGALIDLEPLEPSLRPVPALFPDFSPDELAAVMGGLRLTAFATGDLVIAEGEPGDSLFLVTAGSVKAWIRNREGRYVLARRLGEGDFFGEISVLTGSPRTATVVAASPCELLELDRTTLDGITAAHPRVREVLQRFYEQRIATSADAAAPPGAA